MASFVRAHPESFADLWVDGDTITVIVKDRTSEWLGAARCLERDPFVDNVRFIEGAATLAALDELRDRVRREQDDVERERPDIDITMDSTDIRTGTLTVGVKVLTPEAQTYLVERFGPLVRVVQHDGFVPVP